jgi:hypothetical protein
MNNRTLATLAGVLGVGKLANAVIIWRENYPDAQPWFAVVFAGLFFIGMALARAGRIAGGATLVGLLCVAELVGFPGWTRHNTLDWIFQVSDAAVTLAALVTAIAVFVSRQRRSSASAAAG